ncbi:MAG: hypothetical protein KF891_22905 [Rhizobacter sp.]|nr:hypothetical protein [Rhizobacter sp.]
MKAMLKRSASVAVVRAARKLSVSAQAHIAQRCEAHTVRGRSQNPQLMRGGRA